MSPRKGEVISEGSLGVLMRVDEEQGPGTMVTEPPTAPEPVNTRKTRIWLSVAAAVFVVCVVVFGVVPRVKARATLRKENSNLAIPSVTVVHPKPSQPSQELTLPANVQPYINAPIYARTNGYLKRWYADIGTHVKKGQLLAEIETPEVDQQLQQSRANLGTAQANLNLSQITANRYQDLLKTDSVSKQEADNAAGSYSANQAILQSNRANVRQLEQLQSFQKIYAPFDGVITVRNTDVGALITAGSNGGSNAALFQIAQPGKLRVYVNVPEAYSQATKAGLTAELTLSEFPGRRFPGTLVRTANAIDPSTRTLLAEISVDNPTGTLLSGAYAEVHLKLPTVVSSYLIPVDTLMFRSEGLRVAVVADDQRAELRPITIGRDFGSEVEVLSGISGKERIIANPPDSLLAGQNVRIVGGMRSNGSQTGEATQ
jgi:RND family efflux transporter MFP subunit